MELKKGFLMGEGFFLTEKGKHVLLQERNVFYQTPGIKALFYKENEILIKNLEKHNSIVLDVGCGLGIHLELLSKYCKEVIGIDHSEVMLKYSRKRVKNLGNVKVFNMNARHIEFPDNCFDQTNCMFNTLGNVENPLPILLEMHRVTKPGGHLIFSVYNPESVSERLEFYQRTGLPDAYLDGSAVKASGNFYSRSFSEQEVLKMCNELGVEVKIHKTSLAYICEATKKLISGAANV